MAVFAKGEKEREAREAGADVIGAEDLVERVQGGWMEFDTAVATPDLDGAGRSARQGAGPARAHAEPEAGHRDVRRRAARFAKPRPARSSSASTRPGTCTRRSASTRSAPTSSPANGMALIEAIVRAKPAAAKGVVSAVADRLDDDGARRPGRRGGGGQSVQEGRLGRQGAPGANAREGHGGRGSEVDDWTA